MHEPSEACAPTARRPDRVREIVIRIDLSRRNNDLVDVSDGYQADLRKFPQLLGAIKEPFESCAQAGPTIVGWVRTDCQIARIGYDKADLSADRKMVRDSP